MGEIEERTNIACDKAHVSMTMSPYIWERLQKMKEWRAVERVVSGIDSIEALSSEQNVSDALDKTIISVSTEIQRNVMTPEEYSETVKALAALVEARAELC